MRLVAMLVLLVSLLPVGASAQPGSAANAPFVVEQTYWIKPGKELRERLNMD